jgi:hypothetical protein
VLAPANGANEHADSTKKNKAAILAALQKVRLHLECGENRRFGFSFFSSYPVIA